MIAAIDSGLKHSQAARYVAALREGGSLPAIVESSDGRTLVVKFRGAGQGPTALVAEVIAGELARSLQLPVPSLEIVALDEVLARTERDEEIRDLMLASLGDNLGMQYLSGALAFDPAAKSTVDAELAARVVVFDAFVMNVDRTARNTNLMWWERGLWLIDHGAALYWHHGWDGAIDRPARPFPLIRDHVLLPCAAALPPAAETMQRALTDEVLRRAVDLVPAAWIVAPDVAARRDAYFEFLRARRDGAAAFLEEAERARIAL